MSLFDEIFEIFDATNVSKGHAYTVPSFPPCNVNLVEDGSMCFEFALAGYKKEDLGIDYDSEKNKLVLFTKKEYKPADVKPVKVLVNGIRKSAFTYSYFIPETKFDVNNLKAEFIDGMLYITVPPKKVEERKNSFVIV